MISRRLLALLSVFALTAARLCAGPIQIEAESIIGAGDGLRNDSTASGVAYATNPRDWNPVVIGTLPTSYTSITLWALVRGGPFQLKGLIAGQQKELKWDRTKPPFWTWVNFGTYERAALGEKFLIIRGTGLAADAGIDALIFSDDPTFSPPGSVPLPGTPYAQDAVVSGNRPPAPESPAPGAATVSINWTQPLGPISPDIYSINSFIAFNAARIGDPAYQKGLAYLAPRLVRLHHAGLTTDSVKGWAGWWNTAENSWDYPKIRAALAAWPNTLPGTRRLFSFASWIPGMDLDKNNRLDPDKLDAYAAAAAELVRFMNIECKAGIEYFEITNEKDGSYWVDPAKRNEDYTADLVQIYNTVAVAVRAIDPTLKLGGPAAMRPDFYANLRTFIRGTRAHLNFVSIHAYASGKNSEPDQSIYDKVETMAKHSRELIKIVREEFPAGARPEVHLNEYNIAWTWETREPRMVNHKGAVFDALALTTFAGVEGLNAANAWNDQDGVYGKIAMDGTLRPSAHVFHLFNTFHQGTRVATESSAPDHVVAFATCDAAGRSSLTLINRVNGEQTVTLASVFNVAALRFQRARISETGFILDPVPALLPTQIVLPPHSVTTFYPAE